MLSPHPADPTLTTDNLMEVVKEVEDRWWDLGYRFDGFDMPFSKMREIESLYQSAHHRMEAVVDYYVRYHPTPSWRDVTRTLQSASLYKQADETAKYVKGADVNNVRV